MKDTASGVGRQDRGRCGGWHMLPHAPGGLSPVPMALVQEQWWTGFRAHPGEKEGFAWQRSNREPKKAT